MRDDWAECGDAHLLSSGADGLGALYDRYARTVLRFTLGIVDSLDDADEVVQETFLIAWRKRRAMTLVNDSALPWLLTTARFEALASRRRTIKRASHQVPLVPELHDRQVEAVSGDPLHEVLAELPAADRDVLQAVLVEGLTYAEAAEALGVTVTTVGKRLQRARNRARSLVCADRTLTDEGVC